MNPVALGHCPIQQFATSLSQSMWLGIRATPYAVALRVAAPHPTALRAMGAVGPHTDFGDFVARIPSPRHIGWPRGTHGSLVDSPPRKDNVQMRVFPVVPPIMFGLRQLRPRPEFLLRKAHSVYVRGRSSESKTGSASRPMSCF